MSKRATSADTPDDAATAAASLYVGEVMHARLKPMGHRFNYRVMSLLIDLDRLGAADRQSPLFGVNRPALSPAGHREERGMKLGMMLPIGVGALARSAL